VVSCGLLKSYKASPAIWNHTVLPAARDKWTRPAVILARWADSRFTYPGGMEGWCCAVLLLWADQEKEAARQAEGVADDEGWIKVTRLSKNKAIAASTTRSTEAQDKRAQRKLKKRNREKVRYQILVLLGKRLLPVLRIVHFKFTCISKKNTIEKKAFGTSFCQFWQ